MSEEGAASPELFVDLESSHVPPGGRVAGTAYWNLQETPSALVLRVGWWTQGRGTRDQEIVEEIALRADAPVGKESFMFELPSMPFSFSGKLISLHWDVELEKQPGDVRVSEEFVLGPAEEMVDISRETHEGTGKSLRFGRG